MTSIAYNQGIPNAPNSPSVDQPNMKINNDNIFQYVAVDHVGFNVSGGQTSGRHLQVSFDSNNPPAVPPAVPILFTNIQDGKGNNLPGSLAELFFYSGDHTKSSDNFVSQPTGSVLLLGGIIIKWGTGNANNPAANNTFATPFPNNCFAVVVTNTNAAYVNQFTVANPVAADHFTCLRSSGAGNTGIFYIAIGN